MDAKTIKSMHSYDAWANERVLACCDQLTTEQFVQGNDSPWGSVRNQFVHAFIVHKRWLCWADGSMTGEEAYALRADPEDFPDVASVRSMWKDLHDQTSSLMNRLDADIINTDLSVEMPGVEFSMKTGEILIHIALHSMQHRTEAAMSLSALGQSPGDVDYLFFKLEQSG